MRRIRWLRRGSASGPVRCDRTRRGPLSEALRGTTKRRPASMDYGEMLATVESFEDSHELHAANCLYRDTGQQFVQVCDLLPRVITATGFFRAERIECQRDGARTCDFSIVEFGAQR